jgi:hypothetical protein
MFGLRARLLAVVAVLVVASGAWVGVRAYAAVGAYNAAVAQIDDLRGLANSDPASLSTASLSQAQTDLQALAGELQRLDTATALPVGERMALALPWLGTRYAAARDLVQIGQLGVHAGTSLLEVGQDLVTSLDAGGVNRGADGKPTWLEALEAHPQNLASAARDIKTMQAVRARIDDQVLPDRIRTRLGELDRMLARAEVQTLTSIHIDAALSALGSTRPARYLVVFQNPAELRPTGGFPGTMALLTLEHGQLRSSEFFDAHQLTDVYVQHRQQVVPQPWPLQQFVPQDGLLLHDALWWPDFERSAQQLMDLYTETGWPAIDGVIAVQPEVASDLMRVSGPFSIEFEGQERRITADNVYDEIDRQRVWLRTTPEDRLVHKDILGVIGKTLIDHLKAANRGALLSAVRELGDACRRRDLQIYVASADLEADLDAQGCTGRLQPNANEPTLAVTYANLALAKTSLDMRPKLTLVSDPPREGRRQVRLDIDLRNGAVAEEDPVYAGFQRWWVAVRLPEGSTLLTDRGPMQDPEAPNGGSYLAELFPNITGRITVIFSMPDTPSLLVRRQPGVRPGDVVVRQRDCESGITTELTRDLVVDLSGLCGSPVPPA